MEKNRLIRVIIVEDNQYIREGWATILDSDPDICVINSFESCEDALGSGDYLNANIILLDIGLPGMQGTEAVIEFLNDKPTLSIVMATVFEDDGNVFRSIENGAVGYLLKKVTPEELVQGIKDADAGGSPMSPNIARKVIKRLRKQSGGDKEYSLSEREAEILQLLGEGKSYAAIANQIYLSVDGVGYHIRNIYRKLQVNGKSQAVAKGVSAGLIDLG
jgi:DNA-binding NarL/FixJ family response regulator